MAQTHFTLNTGAKIPALGLGTWQSPPGEVAKSVEHAINTGYTHIDAAYCYGNEDEVGNGLAAAVKSGKVKREDVFVTTKLWCTYHSRAEQNLDLSLKSLGLDYVDLYLMHWPVAMNPDGNHEKFPKHPDGTRDLILSHSHLETWKSMEALLSTGKVKAIGVCNYSVKYLTVLLKHAKVVPAVCQIENHPQLPQDEVVELCKEKGIHVTAYSPFGSTGSPLFTTKVVKEVAAKHGVEVGTVLLSYHNARGSSVLAKSTNPLRIEANQKLIKLDTEDMQKLATVAKTDLRRYVYPEFGVNFGFPDKNTGIVMV